MSCRELTGEIQSTSVANVSPDGEEVDGLVFVEWEVILRVDSLGTFQESHHHCLQVAHLQSDIPRERKKSPWGVVSSSMACVYRMVPSISTVMLTPNRSTE